MLMLHFTYIKYVVYAMKCRLKVLKLDFELVASLLSKFKDKTSDFSVFKSLLVSQFYGDYLQNVLIKKSLHSNG